MNNSSVGFVDAIKLFFKNYANFSGRSTRAEYWWIYLLNILVGVVLSVIPFGVYLSAAWSLVTLIPGLAVAIRRMHDVGKSGWYLLMALIPLVGAILVLIMLLTKSGPRNEWGPTPGTNA